MGNYAPIIALIAIGVLLAIAGYTDYKARIIPNAIPLCILAAGIFTTAGTLLEKLLNLAAMALILVIAEKLMHQHSGGGDIKLYLSMSFAIGLFAFSLVLVVTILLYAIYHALTKQDKLKGSRFPVACFMCPAYCIVCAGASYLLGGNL